MKNVTIAMDDDLAHPIRVAAAKAGQSVSGIWRMWVARKWNPTNPHHARSRATASWKR
jgi:hypothetical protein